MANKVFRILMELFVVCTFSFALYIIGMAAVTDERMWLRIMALIISDLVVFSFGALVVAIWER